MMKKILCLAMTFLMVIGTPMNVFAAEPDWTVTFTGSQIKSDLKGKDLQNLLKNVQPGDEIEISVELSNSSKNKTDWYMENSILKAMEDNQKASGGAYTYILKYINPLGEVTEIFNSRTVGGDSSSNGKKGLYEIEGIGSPFYLDRLNPEEKAFISLYVKLDGETITNGYQDSLTVLNLNFAVEKITEGTKEVTKVNKETVVTYKAPVVVQSAKTGDSAPIVLFSALTFVSAVALIGIAFVTMKKRRNEEGE